MALRVGIGFVFLSAVLMVLSAVLTERWMYYFLGLACVLLATTVWHTYRCREGFPRAAMAAYALTATLLLVLIVVMMVVVQVWYPANLLPMRWFGGWAIGALMGLGMFAPLAATTLDPMGRGFARENMEENVMTGGR